MEQCRSALPSDRGVGPRWAMRRSTVGSASARQVALAFVVTIQPLVERRSGLAAPLPRSVTE
jgi:hypothetical protein